VNHSGSRTCVLNALAALIIPNSPLSIITRLSVPPGTRLGPYTIVARIGVGGMGEVYLAEDPRLGRNLAIKLLPPELDRDAERLDRFISEAKAASALNHPNIITVYEIDQVDGAYYLATEFIGGITWILRCRWHWDSGPRMLRESCIAILSRKIL
jgi:serine/threonine protein kinase